MNSRIQNSFFGAIPRHPLITEQIVQILNHVQTSYYEHHAWMATSTALLYHTFQLVESRNKTVSKEKHLVGKFINGEEQVFRDKGDKDIVIHKCLNCSQGHDWKDGNNYVTLFNKRQYWCEDSFALFEAL